MATGRSNTQLGLSPSGEATASGGVFLMDDAHTIFREVMIDAGTLDAKRLPNTTLEPGLALKKLTTTWTHVTNGSTSATDKMAILHNNNVPLSLPDSGGTAIAARAMVCIHGLVNPANVRDTAGNALDATGRAGLADPINGCCILFGAV